VPSCTIFRGVKLPCFFVHVRWLQFVLMLLGASATLVQSHAVSPSPSFFQCGGELETRIWQQWDNEAKGYVVKQLIAKRLVARGDTYALYDFEMSFHNLLAMAQRCQRVDRQLELAEAVKLTYLQLQQDPSEGSGMAWICRGGAICNEKNRLINTEVMLTSVQFLAFATSMANGLVRNLATSHGESFSDETARIVLQHLQRWSGIQARQTLRKRIAAKRTDIKDGSSTLLLTDKDLWQIAIYADLAGILVQRPTLKNILGLDDQKFGVLREQVTLLLKLFHARTTLMTVTEPGGQKVVVADLERGFWRLFADNRYAGYNGENSPVNCVSVPGYPEQKKIEIRIDARTLEPMDEVGWDISHARRLVHFFEAVERNRDALQSVYGLSDKDIPSQQVMASFARQLLTKVWNQDADYPLFANYYSGVNGWYRVAYDNGTGRCMKGIPPYGLTNSFPTGGYSTWGVFDNRLSALAQRLYVLSKSNKEIDKIFIKTYYSNFSGSASPGVRLISEQMFWPSLILN
jgi:hypothetical protein